jgi:hypothetical protein
MSNYKGLTIYGSVSEYEDTFYCDGIAVFTPLDMEERRLFINCINIAESVFERKLTLKQVNRIIYLINNRER